MLSNFTGKSVFARSPHVNIAINLHYDGAGRRATYQEVIGKDDAKQIRGKVAYIFLAVLRGPKRRI